jgi:hypothetical protein
VLQGWEECCEEQNVEKEKGTKEIKINKNREKSNRRRRRGIRMCMQKQRAIKQRAMRVKQEN